MPTLNELLTEIKRKSRTTLEEVDEAERIYLEMWSQIDTADLLFANLQPLVLAARSLEQDYKSLANQAWGSAGVELNRTTVDAADVRRKYVEAKALYEKAANFQGQLVLFRQLGFYQPGYRPNAPSDS